MKGFCFQGSGPHAAGQSRGAGGRRVSRQVIRALPDREPTRSGQVFPEAPPINIPSAPPLPPPPPPPPPPEDPKLFGVTRRGIMPFVVGIPLGLVWRWGLLRNAPDTQTTGYVDVQTKTKDGRAKMVRREVVRVKGKNGMDYLVGEDSRGRMYMFDRDGVLYYDSGMKEIGWYVVSPDGETVNVFEDQYGEVQVVPVGDIDKLKKYEFDAFGGIKFESPKTIYAFEDDRVLEVPEKSMKVTKDGEIVLPYTLDEGEIKLRPKKFVNPFEKKSDEPFGGPLKRDVPLPGIKEDLD